MTYTMAKIIISAATLLTASALLLLSKKGTEKTTYKITPEYMIFAQSADQTLIQPTTVQAIDSTQIKPTPDIKSYIVNDYLTKVIPEITDNILISMKKTRDIPLYAINTPDQIASMVEYLENADREYAYIIHLNTKNRLIGVENVAMGALNQMITQPREIFKGALLNNAAGIIFVHNHPSGDPKPSVEDISVTSKLVEVGKLIDIQLLDAIIIGRDKYISLKESGYI